ncbi:MAG: hypothetical protein H7Y27_09995 [Gemmatimonadaceae bacterium]|nr:hypothetical protein [Chitinophagaceae bacterium]
MRIMIAFFLGLIVFSLIATSTTKEVLDVKDHILKTAKPDTIIKEICSDNLSMANTEELFVGFWHVKAHEIESYSNGVLVSKKWDFLSGTHTSHHYTSNKGYTSVYKGEDTGGGTWNFLSTKYFVFDKGVIGEERYYYLVVLDASVMITRGPFKADGTFYTPNTIYNFYYSKSAHKNSEITTAP